MLQEFDGATRILNLEPGIWNLTPKRRSRGPVPSRWTTGKSEVFTGYQVQYNITLGPAKGGSASPRREPRRSHRARRVDDMEVRGRPHFPSEAAKAASSATRRACRRRELEALTRRYVSERLPTRLVLRRMCPAPGCEHEQANHGVVRGHLQHARRPYVDCCGDRQTSRTWADRWDAARPLAAA